MRGGGTGAWCAIFQNAPDFIKNSDRAAIPSLVPRRTGMRDLKAFISILRWWLYLGHFRSIWFLVSRVALVSQGQVLGSVLESWLLDLTSIQT